MVARAILLFYTLRVFMPFGCKCPLGAPAARNDYHVVIAKERSDCGNLRWWGGVV